MQATGYLLDSNERCSDGSFGLRLAVPHSLLAIPGPGKLNNSPLCIATLSAPHPRAYNLIETHEELPHDQQRYTEASQTESCLAALPP